jgi:hypothetical protein
MERNNSNNNNNNYYYTWKKHKKSQLVDAAIPNSHNLHRTTTEKLQKYTDLKEEFVRIWQPHGVYILLSTTAIITTAWNSLICALLCMHSNAESSNT